MLLLTSVLNDEGVCFLFLRLHAGEPTTVSAFECCETLHKNLPQQSQFWRLEVNAALHLGPLARTLR